jgi:hypothetical protein
MFNRLTLVDLGEGHGIWVLASIALLYSGKPPLLRLSNCLQGLLLIPPLSLEVDCQDSEGVVPDTRCYSNDHKIVVACNERCARIFLASLNNYFKNHVVGPAVSIAGVSVVAGTIVTQVEQACLAVRLLDGALTLLVVRHPQRRRRCRCKVTHDRRPYDTGIIAGRQATISVYHGCVRPMAAMLHCGTSCNIITKRRIDTHSPIVIRRRKVGNEEKRSS